MYYVTPSVSNNTLVALIISVGGTALGSKAKASVAISLGTSVPTPDNILSSVYTAPYVTSASEQKCTLLDLVNSLMLYVVVLSTPNVKVMSV